MARRALDYLVGFGISPVLWRRLPGARSAGDKASVGRGRLLGVRTSGLPVCQLQAFFVNAVPAYYLCACYFSSARGKAMLAVRDNCCGCCAAGRVQSVALRLASEREDEIDAFKPQEYWSVDVQFRGPHGKVRGQA